MNRLEYKQFYRRNLPHYQPVNAKLFVTFRLAGTLPFDVINKLKQEKESHAANLVKIENLEKRKDAEYLFQKRLFAKYDKYLDSAKTGPVFLKQESIAEIVYESILFRNAKFYDLDAFCIMPNHVHLVFQPLTEGCEIFSISKIMHSLKRYTSREANKILARTGQFWQHENYDHVVRDEDELTRIIQYILYNPAKAGYVENWKDWKWIYCRF